LGQQAQTLVFGIRNANRHRCHNFLSIFS
jgi:hypothetical protein